MKNLFFTSTLTVLALILCLPGTAHAATGWSSPALLNTNGTSDSGFDVCPQIIEDGMGTLHAVWYSYEDLGSSAGTDYDIFYATNSGTGWSLPILLNTNGAGDSADDYGPQIMEDSGGTLHAVWYSFENLGSSAGTDYDIFYATTSDTVWSSPALLNTNGTGDSGDDYNPQIIEDSSGTLHAVWQSFENLGSSAGTDLDIFYSTNSGTGWSVPALLNTNGTGDSGADYVPQIIEHGSGTLHAVWYSGEDLGGSAGTDDDIFYARDPGTGWSSPALLNTNGATDSGADYSPQIIKDSSGTLHAVWESLENLGSSAGIDEDIFYSTNSGTGWSSPILLNTNGTTDLYSDENPEIIEDSSGTLHAVWYSTEDLGSSAGTDPDIFYARDSGNGWSSPILLNTNGTGDSGYDYNPQIIEDSSGRLRAVWYSGEDLGGTAGTEDDIFYATGISIGSRACQFFQSVPDYGQTSAPELARAGINYGNNRVMAQVKDGSTDAQIQQVFFTLDFEPTSLAVLPDFTGTSAPELACLGRRASDGCNLADVRDASNGALLKRVYFHAQFIPFDLECVSDFGQTSAPELVTLARRPSDTAIMGAKRDASSRLLLGPRTWFHADFLPVDIEIAADISGNGVDELVSLQQRPSDGAIISEVKDASTNSLVTRVWYDNSYTYAPVDVEVVSDFGGTTAPEVAMLRLRLDNNTVAVEVMDTWSGFAVGASPLTFLSSSIRPMELEVVSDFGGGSTAPEVVVLGHNPSTNAVVGEVRDASTGTLIATVSFDSAYRPKGIEVLTNFGGTGAWELAVHGVHPSTGAVIGEVKDASTGALLQTCTFSKFFVIP